MVDKPELRIAIEDGNVRSEPEHIDENVHLTTFDEYIGQRKIKERIQILIEEARSCDKALPHMLFYGPPGLGKTEMAYLISNVLGVGFHTILDPSTTKEIHIRQILGKIALRDLIFADEIHKLRHGREVLHSAMQDFQIDDEEGGIIKVPHFGFLAATTKVGQIRGAFKDRFIHQFAFELYPPEDLAKIISNYAKARDVAIDDDAALEIGRRSRGTPRIAKNLLLKVQSYARRYAPGIITLGAATDACEFWGIDALGLNEMHYKYMRALIEKYSGGPIGPTTLAVALRVELDTIREMEPDLVGCGMLKLKQSYEREATRLAHTYFKDK
jgi:Holliday junction DNA helicase RuvB